MNGEGTDPHTRSSNQDLTQTLALVRRAQDADAIAREQLFVHIRPRLEAWIASRVGPRLRTRLDVEDLFQEICMSAHTALDSFSPDGNEAAFWRWITTIAHNRIRDAHRYHVGAQKRSAEAEQRLEHQLTSSWTSPSLRAVRRDQHERLLLAIARLDEPHRDVLRVVEFEHHSYKEAASILGISASNVSARLTRARTKLGELIRKSPDDWTRA